MQSKSTNVSVNIVDDVTPPPTTVTLATSDGNATEPHSVYYLPAPTEDNGEATFTFANWAGGNVGLSLSGNATYGSDYVLALADESYESSFDPTSLVLYVPAGATSVKLLVKPLGDLIETDSGENVTISIASVPTGVTGGGTATVTITDELEAIKIDANPSENLEYRVDPIYADFRITPVDNSVQMKGLVYLDIDASATDSAIPGIDYALEVQYPYPYLLPITLVNPAAKLYRTTSFSIDDLNRQLVRVLPVDDKVLEQDEKIKVTLRSAPRYTQPTPDLGTFGDATITIIDKYLDSEKMADPGACSCSCNCAGDFSIGSAAGVSGGQT